MSYNIDRWRTKELSLVIPLDGLIAVDEMDVKQVPGTRRVKAQWDVEGFELIGRLSEDDQLVTVEKLEYWGEGSGWGWQEFKNILAGSTGSLIASQVWEGGDSITRLTVKDGNITEEEIEL